MTTNSRRRKQQNGSRSLAAFQFEQRMAETAFLMDDIEIARAECAEVLLPLSMAALEAAYQTLDGLALWRKHDFWTKAAAAVAEGTSKDEAKELDVG